MPAQDSIDAMNTQMDVASLYREEVVTDRKVGTIHVLTPILDSGERDTNRPLLFLGDTQIMTQMGPLPISFEIKAETLAEAVAGYGEAAKQGVRDTIEKLQACAARPPARSSPRACRASRRRLPPAVASPCPDDVRGRAAFGRPLQDTS